MLVVDLSLEAVDRNLFASFLAFTFLSFFRDAMLMHRRTCLYESTSQAVKENEDEKECKEG